MKRHWHIWTNPLSLGVLLLCLGPVFAQAPPSASSSDALHELVAPVALYPDDLLSQVLVASAYPDEIQAAAKWSDQNKGLSESDRNAALASQPWDASVRAVAPFPETLNAMAQNRDWTEALGEAYLAQPDAVCGAVQDMRQQAVQADNLKSGPETAVAQDGNQVTISLVGDAVFEPVYDPTVIYGDHWHHHDHWDHRGMMFRNVGRQFHYNRGPNGYHSVSRMDWAHHEVDGRPGSGHEGKWGFDPAHRGGAPFKSAALNRQYGKGSSKGTAAHPAGTASHGGNGFHSPMTHAASTGGFHGQTPAKASTGAQPGGFHSATASAGHTGGFHNSAQSNGGLHSHAAGGGFKGHAPTAAAGHAGVAGGHAGAARPANAPRPAAHASSGKKK